MANLSNRPTAAAAATAWLFIVATLLLSCQRFTEAQIGVCYGRNGNNLPSPQDVINLYKSRGITRMRMYDPGPNSLQALRGTNIGLILDVPRTDLRSLGSDAGAATRWVQKNVVAYASNVNFRYIAVGNEIMPGDAEAGSILPAMQNVQNALRSANLADRIKVSTAVKSSIVDGFPPSKGFFTSSSYMNPIVNFLRNNNSPLLANIYPYFAYLGTGSIRLDYALFTSPNAQVNDDNGLQYKNLFDALVDTMYAALARAGGPNIPIVVSESGWPSAGGDSRGAATPGNAATYYANLIGHVRQGTPRKNGQAIETYLFAMFDENQKGGGTENNFGVFSPNQQPKYNLNFRG
ncbi:glucan endo-1,3-beta-glucosidase isoform X2 [Spinacia oleracea]|uniref:Glucan endo-1,3-beta-glucosidase isoform X2 n=1 Tax=Spinacia oleracea TaxID=3562 RepID=A0ABM3RWB8_SPIOL|nr:glucan endo-1,3-beta-glucosidase-like isoform X2 [Spinacia oleracea]